MLVTGGPQGSCGKRCRPFQTRPSCRVNRIALIDGTDLLGELIAGYFALHTDILVCSYSSTEAFFRTRGGVTFDLLLVDPLSEGVAGARDVARLVRGAGGAPVILFSRELAAEHREALAAAGASGLLGKRMDPPALVAAVKGMVAGLGIARTPLGEGGHGSLPPFTPERLCSLGCDRPPTDSHWARDAYRAASHVLAPNAGEDPRSDSAPPPAAAARSSREERSRFRVNLTFGLEVERTTARRPAS